MFYHAPNEGLISPKHSVQIGIRTEYEQQGHGFNVINAMEANDLSADDIVSGPSTARFSHRTVNCFGLVRPNREGR